MESFLLTLNIFHILLYCFYYWLWTGKFRLARKECDFYVRHTFARCSQLEKCTTLISKPIKLRPTYYYEIKLLLWNKIVLKEKIALAVGGWLNYRESEKNRQAFSQLLFHYRKNGLYFATWSNRLHIWKNLWPSY